MKLLLIALLALSLSTPAYGSDWPAVDTLAASRVGHHVDVRCVTQRQWDADPLVSSPRVTAYTAWRGDTPLYSVLPPRICGPLVLLIADPNGRVIKGYVKEEAEALLTFLHEDGHLAGTKDEGVVECNAIRTFSAVALGLGVKRAKTKAMLETALLLHLDTPPAYQTVC